MADALSRRRTARAARPRQGPRSRRPGDHRRRQRPLLGKACAAADGRLVRACLEGREEAWHALVERYQSLVYSIILDLDRGREDPAALFVTVWREIGARLGEPEPGTDFCTWVVALTLEECGSSAKLADERSIGRLIELQRLRWCLAELPPPCRDLLLDHLAAEPICSGEEIARRLDLPAADWPAVLHVCLERLQRCLIRHELL